LLLPGKGVATAHLCGVLSTSPRRSPDPSRGLPKQPPAPRRPLGLTGWLCRYLGLSPALPLARAAYSSVLLAERCQIDRDALGCSPPLISHCGVLPLCSEPRQALSGQSETGLGSFWDRFA